MEATKIEALLFGISHTAFWPRDDTDLVPFCTWTREELLENWRHHAARAAASLAPGGGAPAFIGHAGDEEAARRPGGPWMSVLLRRGCPGAGEGTDATARAQGRGPVPAASPRQRRSWCRSRGLRAAVRCCHDGGQGVAAGAYGCHRSATYAEAFSICNFAGLRLCSAEELEAGAGCGSGSSGAGAGAGGGGCRSPSARARPAWSSTGCAG
mmetsp:Transcript_99111/g.317987  ORF Transcript_99111/g.317987 Transcript_99111/m.317987 type:complete len:211 (+) Transcript_99111:1420-2052(+)